MRSRFVIIAAALATAGLLATAIEPASAAKPPSHHRPPVVQHVSSVVYAHTHSGRAVVRARYRCSGGNVGTHLFIGVKQGRKVNATTHTSSDFARTFYSTNWNSDGPGLSLICNGKSHSAKFVVKPDPFWKHAKTAPPLHSGRAFVQFCIFDSTNKGDDDPNSFAFDYSIKKVVAFRR
jgi:hypothetical protein